MEEKIKKVVATSSYRKVAENVLIRANVYNRFDDIICGLDNLFGGSAKSDRDMAIESLRKIEEEKNKLQMLDSLSDVMQEIIKTLKEKNLIIGF